MISYTSSSFSGLNQALTLGGHSSGLGVAMKACLTGLSLLTASAKMGDVKPEAVSVLCTKGMRLVIIGLLFSALIF